MSKVQEERIELGQGRDRLEDDRRQLATQRHRDPLIATAITSAVWLLVCALPLLLPRGQSVLSLESNSETIDKR